MLASHSASTPGVFGRLGDSHAGRQAQSLQLLAGVGRLGIDPCFVAAALCASGSFSPVGFRRERQDVPVAMSFKQT